MALDKPIIETTYLTAPNVHRYRTILRHFYRQHQKLNYWMVLDEVYTYVHSIPGFSDYTHDQCQQDLNTLVEWKNLMATQDAGKVQSIEEFQNRRFRYQLTPYSIEIERLTIKLESISGVGGSLEANLFERIAERIRQLPTVIQQSNSLIHAWWQDLSTDFQRLNDNATDYIASLQSSGLDDLINTVAFLNYKDAIIEYLRSFIRELQRFGPVIESLLRQANPETIEQLVSKVVAYEQTIPRVGQPVNVQELLAEIASQWQSLQAWFLGLGSKESESARLLGITNGIIRKITRYAYRLAETQNRAVSRHKEYMHLCQLFARCEALNEAHRLSAAVFGAFHTRHLCGEFPRTTESTSSGVFEELAFYQEIRPKVRNFREKALTEGIRDKQQAKEQARQEYLLLQQAEAAVIARYIKNDVIDFALLPVIEPFVRTTLLRWVGKAIATKERLGKTEDGRTYKVHVGSLQRKIVVNCVDGTLEMPPLKIEFIA